MIRRKSIICILVIGFSIALISSNVSAQTAQNLFYDAFELMKAGKFLEAATKYEEGLKIDPKNAIALHYLGEAYLGLGAKDKAKEKFQASLNADPNSRVAGDAKKRLDELPGDASAQSGQSESSSSGPSAEETVEFINGLFECEVVRTSDVPQYGFDKALYRYERQTSRLRWSPPGTLLIVENIKQSAAYRNTGMSPEHEVEFRENSTNVEMRRLIPELELRGPNARIQCNPSFGACINESVRKGKVFSLLEPKLGIKTEKEALSIAKEYFNAALPTKKQSRSWWLNFCSEADAERAARALKHLITISGGKKSLF